MIGRAGGLFFGGSVCGGNFPVCGLDGRAIFRLVLAAFRREPKKIEQLNQKMRTEKNKINGGVGRGEDYVQTWERLLDARDRLDHVVASRSGGWSTVIAERDGDSLRVERLPGAAAAAAGWESRQVERAGGGKLVSLSGVESAALQFRADTVGALIVERSDRLAARAVSAIRWAGCGGGGVAAGAESRGDDVGTIKHLDHSDRAEFCGVFAALLAPFGARWSTVERLLDPARLAGPLTVSEDALIGAVREAIKIGNRACRDWVNSRGGVRGEGSVLVSLDSPTGNKIRDELAAVSLDRPAKGSGESAIMRPAPGLTGWGRAGGSLAFYPRSFQHGNAHFPSLGWSRFVRFSTWEAEFSALEKMTNRAIAAQTPNNRGRARVQFGGLLSDFRGLVLGEGADFGEAIHDDGAQGVKARAALGERVTRWRGALDRVGPSVGVRIARALCGLGWCRPDPAYVWRIARDGGILGSDGVDDGEGSPWEHREIARRAIWDGGRSWREYVERSAVWVNSRNLREWAVYSCARAAAAVALGVARLACDAAADLASGSACAHLVAAARGQLGARCSASWEAAADAWGVVAEDARALALIIGSANAVGALSVMVFAIHSQASCIRSGVLCELGEVRRLARDTWQGRADRREAARRRLVAMLGDMRAALRPVAGGGVLGALLAGHVRSLLARAVRRSLRGAALAVTREQARRAYDMRDAEELSHFDFIAISGADSVEKSETIRCNSTLIDIKDRNYREIQKLKARA